MDMSEVQAFEDQGHKLLGKALLKKFVPKELAQELASREMSPDSFAKLYLGEFAPTMPNMKCPPMFKSWNPPRRESKFWFGMDLATKANLVILDELAQVDAMMVEAWNMPSPPSISTVSASEFEKKANTMVPPRWDPIDLEREAKYCDRIADLLLWEPMDSDDVRYEQVAGAWLRGTEQEQVPVLEAFMPTEIRQDMPKTAPKAGFKLRPVHHVCAFGKVLMMLGHSARAAAEGIRRSFAGLSEMTIREVVTRNDRGDTFVQIATYLRDRARALRGI